MGYSKKYMHKQGRRGLIIRASSLCIQLVYFCVLYCGSKTSYL